MGIFLRNQPVIYSFHIVTHLMVLNCHARSILKSRHDSVEHGVCVCVCVWMMTNVCAKVWFMIETGSSINLPWQSNYICRFAV